MPFVLCRNCRVANPDEQALCHCCGAKLPGARTASIAGGNAHPIEERYRRIEQHREATTASRCLLGAAIVLLVRGTAYPLLLTQVPYEMNLGLDPQMLRMLSYSAAACIFALFMLARTNPLPAALMAVAVYIAICVPDIANGQGWLGKGIIGKVIMAGPLCRALISGMMHWLHEPRRHREQVAAPRTTEAASEPAPEVSSAPVPEPV
jgi:hypothetical protein